MPTSKPAPFPRRPRCHFSRSRAGCLTCRIRRKKCDETKPVCGGCDQGKRTCTWPTPRAVGPGPGGTEPYISVRRKESPIIDPASFPANLPPGIVPVRIVMDGGKPPACMAPEISEGLHIIHEHPNLGHPHVSPPHQSSSSSPDSLGIHLTPNGPSSGDEHWSSPPGPMGSGSADPPYIHGPGMVPPPTYQQPVDRVPSSGVSMPVSHDLQYQPELQSPNMLPLSMINAQTDPITLSVPPIAMVPPAMPMATVASMSEYQTEPASASPLSNMSDFQSIPASTYHLITSSYPAYNNAAPISTGPPITSISALMMPNDFTETSTSQKYQEQSPVSRVTANEPYSPSMVPVSDVEPISGSAPGTSYEYPGPSTQTTTTTTTPPTPPTPIWTGPYSQPRNQRGSFSNTEASTWSSVTTGCSIRNYSYGEIPPTITEDTGPIGIVIPPKEPARQRIPNAPHRNARAPTPIRMSGYVSVADNGNVTELTESGETILGAMTEQQFAEYIGKFIDDNDSISPSLLLKQQIVSGGGRPRSRDAHPRDTSVEDDDDGAVPKVWRPSAGESSSSSGALALTRKEQKLQLARHKRMQDANDAVTSYVENVLYSTNGRDFSVPSKQKRLAARMVTRFSVPRNIMGFADNTQLDPRSHLLFKHYLDHVADELVSCHDTINPLRRYVLPLAQRDDILMHAMLAAGGAYFCFEESVNPALGEVSRRHYSIVLSRLRPAIQSNKYAGEEDRIYLVSIMLLLSLFETLAGSTYGSILMHLHACRTVLLSLFDNPPEDPRSDVGVMFGFLSECYIYSGTMAAVSTLLCEHKSLLPIDPFMRDLSFLKKFPTCRCMLGISHSLFQMLPDVIDLGVARFEEEKTNEASVEVFQKYRVLLQKITEWTDPDDDGTMRMDWKNASTVFQHSMAILLHNLYYFDLRSDPDVWADVNQRVEAAFPLLLSVALSSNIGAMMLFPCLVFASSTEQEWLRGTFRYGIMASKFKSCSMKQALIVLQKLWDDPAPKAFGPRGLGYIMKKHGIIFTLV